MGLPYLPPEDILSQNTNIRSNLAQGRPTWCVRSGLAQSLIYKRTNANSAILEVGCGAGALASELIEKGYKKIALVDIDDYLMEDVRQKVDIKLLDVCFNPLPFNDNTLDSVLAFAIVEHLENPYFFAREVSRILKKGGVFFFSVPNIFSLRAKLGFMFRGDIKGYSETNNHITLFTKAVFNKVFCKHFVISEIYFDQGYISLLGKKIRFPKMNFFGKWFGAKVLYVLEKK
ncbi:MAG: hypothetical protein A3G52_03555 [Candidatus Taylorbacteria bacterium RIFCSPLOWO2_12_FULL_43_20]|uniref:Methyltransferase type 11 domain-containing protein n=1 Tax=Candidatus Taylorbacteria bacterium RIFCSPLOWO2_12_FULL_43_20 TaxID=1802332 RepID=A0A1G2P0L7_9BACT|nr:MAG: hypothetical protein A2825_02500 [Candidatus Taylorbacteria bacterium RIFCSPHIGHO2_01_FULL_43_120]OHA22423.1 MAG: hypothetical protein A3B98_02400 [Candidatus Taylorbacteria bacterium RIFCSPHIGHO2_02_FULL_43_55]OHA28362.1 MAG: hypothetical protein A3E92_00570 [Candidatus Taylorbacteria bacterium RIFCSPHIGHO2_12_FULL_42_34]OHA30636.1 MAG: hypothetical protein A3B09_00450 [Candidatus Taylorbacteria bacterium RIFCSPLOWO2_01_FULL_43_83]OHA38533.1 MAG: hypothetical protein A3H58_03095 [Candi